ncbi:MAG: hypothetical protein ABGZ53_23010 [Fuerstiella sp.]
MQRCGPDGGVDMTILLRPGAAADSPAQSIWSVDEMPPVEQQFEPSPGCTAVDISQLARPEPE